MVKSNDSNDSNDLGGVWIAGVRSGELFVPAMAAGVAVYLALAGVVSDGYALLGLALPGCRARLFANEEHVKHVPVAASILFARADFLVGVNRFL